MDGTVCRLHPSGSGSPGVACIGLPETWMPERPEISPMIERRAAETRAPPQGQQQNDDWPQGGAGGSSAGPSVFVGWHQTDKISHNMATRFLQEELQAWQVGRCRHVRPRV